MGIPNTSREEDSKALALKLRMVVQDLGFSVFRSLALDLGALRSPTKPTRGAGVELRAAIRVWGFRHQEILAWAFTRGFGTRQPERLQATGTSMG